MRHRNSLVRLCGFLFAFLVLSAMSECPGPSTNDQGGGGGGMDESESGGGAY
jgi:hypothetical protein